MYPSTLTLSVYDCVVTMEYIHGFCFGTKFSTGDISDIVELGMVLRSIRDRLVAEGKIIDNKHTAL